MATIKSSFQVFFSLVVGFFIAARTFISDDDRPETGAHTKAISRERPSRKQSWNRAGLAADDDESIHEKERIFIASAKRLDDASGAKMARRRLRLIDTLILIRSRS